MESENLNHYLLLFHLLEYWDREWRKNMTDTWIRFEACDTNDPDTLVGLNYQGSLPPPSQRAKNPSQRFSFDPKQIVDSSITNLCFFDSYVFFVFFIVLASFFAECPCVFFLFFE